MWGLARNHSRSLNVATPPTPVERSRLRKSSTLTAQSPASTISSSNWVVSRGQPTRARAGERHLLPGGHPGGACHITAATGALRIAYAAWEPHLGFDELRPSERLLTATVLLIAIFQIVIARPRDPRQQWI